MSKDEISAKLETIAQLASELQSYFDSLPVKANSHGISPKPSRASLPIGLLVAQIRNHVDLLIMAHEYEAPLEENETSY